MRSYSLSSYRRVFSGTLIRNCVVEGAISRRVMMCPSTISLPGGCNWTGSTANLENHLLHCNMKVVECNFKARGCILRSYQRELAQHLTIYPNRTEKCPPVVRTFHIVIKQAVMQFVLANWYHVQTVVEFRCKGRF